MVDTVQTNSFPDIGLWPMVDTGRSCEVDRYGEATVSDFSLLCASGEQHAGDDRVAA